MEGIEVIFWVVLALVWLISGSLLRKRSRREKERLQEQREAYAEPEEETVEMFPEEELSEVFKVLRGEEKGIPVSEQFPIVLPPVEEPEVTETIEVKKLPEREIRVSPVFEPSPEEEELEIELEDLETLGRGILISEILGPPRAKKPFRKIL
jgi:flagellar biosynthesis/type III secretory pathway M-ring protein FliF/YscJ